MLGDANRNLVAPLSDAATCCNSRGYVAATRSHPPQKIHHRQKYPSDTRTRFGFQLSFSKKLSFCFWFCQLPLRLRTDWTRFERLASKNGIIFHSGLRVRVSAKSKAKTNAKASAKPKGRGKRKPKVTTSTVEITGFSPTQHTTILALSEF